MKKRIQIAILGIIFSLLSFGTSVFAAGFDLDPARSGTGFASINSCKVSCANQKNSLAVNIPNPGDSQEFYIFLDFRNSSSGFITSPHGHLYLPQSGTDSSVYIDTALTGGYARTVHDGVTVTNLPSSWKMEFVPGADSYVQIPVHTLTNRQTCEQYYGKDFSYTGIQFSNPESVAIPTDASNSLPGLDYQYAQGWCQQGYVTYKIRVTNTSTHTQNLPLVDTDAATSITQNSAVFNGHVTQGDNLRVWFVYGDSYSSVPNCSQTMNRVSLNGQYSAGDRFSISSPSLRAGVRYSYRVCAEDGNGNVAEGDLVDFQTLAQTTWHWETGAWGACQNGVQRREVRCVDNQGNEDVSQVNCDSTTRPSDIRSCSQSLTLPELETLDERNVDEDSAELRGRVAMNDIDNGLIFFVYGKDRARVEGADGFSSYGSIPEYGQFLQKKITDSDNDYDSWRDFSEYVHGLESNERYYYQICVEYEYQNNTEIECGGVESFRTEDDGNGTSSYEDDNSSIVIETLAPQAVGRTSAKVCGDLIDDGGNSSILTWIEYREVGDSSYKRTPKRSRGEGTFCEVIRNLKEGTQYVYRACSEELCASSRYFTTAEQTIPTGIPPRVSTGVAYDIRAHSAKLPAKYISNAERAVVYFKYGRSRFLNKRTKTYTIYGVQGEVVHPFTNLKADQYYCYQAVIETEYGKDEGAIRCFYTLTANGSGTVRTTRTTPRTRVVTVVKDDQPEIDLNKLGIGLSLLQLDIDDMLDSVAKGQQVNYVVHWKNVSKLNLRDLELNVEIPREIQIMGSSRGIVDRDRNSIFYTIDRLDLGEEGSMTITGTVIDGNVGDALTANATIAFDNPVNEAQENATDYDVDTFVLPVAGVNIGAGSIFGLRNVTFLGWLTILLGLLIIFLIARWLYLEREDLRARAYASRMYGGGYYPPAPSAPAPSPRPAPRGPVPSAPAVSERNFSLRDVPSQREMMEQDDDPGYRPYRPNRG